MSEITRAKFKAATGVDPVDDDLERCNCKKAGEAAHWMCGWDEKRNLPVFWPSDPPPTHRRDLMAGDEQRR